jgi:hypothetical protein
MGLPLNSQRQSVEALNRNALQVNAFEAANIDCRHPIALWIGAFSVRVNATCPAKAVLDNVLVESVRAAVLFGCEQVQPIARHKPQERSFTGTDRAIACHRLVDFAFHLERNLTAMAATFVLHFGSP